MLKIQHFLSKGKEKMGGAGSRQKNAAAQQSSKTIIGGERLERIFIKNSIPPQFSDKQLTVCMKPLKRFPIHKGFDCYTELKHGVNKNTITTAL